MLATDGVFSMDGDIARLPHARARLRARTEPGSSSTTRTASACSAHRAAARSSISSLDAEDVPVLVGTLGKAFGSFGAFVAGSADLIELLMQKARTYIYTTALPQPVAAATRKALRDRQARVLAARASAGAHRALPRGRAATRSAARCVGHADPAGDSRQRRTRRCSAQNQLLEAGFLGRRFVRRPCRTARHACASRCQPQHTEAQVDALVETLGRVQTQRGRQRTRKRYQ